MIIPTKGTLIRLAKRVRVYHYYPSHPKPEWGSADAQFAKPGQLSRDILVDVWTRLTLPDNPERSCWVTQRFFWSAPPDNLKQKVIPKDSEEYETITSELTKVLLLGELIEEHQVITDPAFFSVQRMNNRLIFKYDSYRGRIIGWG